jgi:hypothetical protein
MCSGSPYPALIARPDRRRLTTPAATALAATLLSTGPVRGTEPRRRRKRRSLLIIHQAAYSCSRASLALEAHTRRTFMDMVEGTEEGQMDEAILSAGDALLLVDVQNDFCPGGALPIPEGDRVVPVLNEWIEVAREGGTPSMHRANGIRLGIPVSRQKGESGRPTAFRTVRERRSILRSSSRTMP